MAFAIAGEAESQISLDPSPNNIEGNTVCTQDGILQISDSEDECDVARTTVQTITFGSSGDQIILDGTDGSADFSGAVNFNSTNVQFNSGTQSFSGTSTFNSTVSFVGPSVTFDTGTTFQNPATFNGTTDFNAGMTTTNINNSGTILSSTVSANTVGAFFGNFTDLSVNGSVNLGNHVVHGVAAGVVNTDAVNVAQLNAATSGVTTRVETLEAVAVFHDLEITAVQEVNATQDTRLTAVEGVNAAQDTRLSAVEGVNADQATQIAAIETVNATQDTRIIAVEGVNAAQASQITAIQALNTTQSSQISALQLTQELVSDRVDTLFDLRSMDRRDMRQGIAAAMSMAPAPMPSQPGRVAYAVNGATFRGKYAVGGSMTYRLNTRAPMAVNVGFSYAGNKNNGARVGIAGEF